MKRNIILTMLAVLIAFAACKKNQYDLEYKDVNRIMLSGPTTVTRDSTSFTFSTQPVNVTEYDVNFVASISGNVSDKDRTFKIIVDQANTTAIPSEYSLPSTFLIKGGTFTSIVPITIKRSARLDNMAVKLTLKLENNENFATSERMNYRFVWTNDVVIPSNWNSVMSPYLGKYSKVKHRLLISANPNNSNLELVSGAVMVVTLRDNALIDLNAYNLANPTNPLKSEFGEVIGFCSGCN